MRTICIKSLFSIILSSLLLPLITDAKPNVVFIIVDDLNDMVYQPEGKPIVPTPNLDRLKDQGVTFLNAHNNDPLCAPSRASMIFGLYPQTTSLYWFEPWRRNGILNKSVSLFDNLRDSDYKVYGTGKIDHGGNERMFDEYGFNQDFGPWPWDGRRETAGGFVHHPQQSYLLEGPDEDIDYEWEHVFGRLSDTPEWPADPANGIPGYKGWMLYGKPYRYVDSMNRDPLPDELAAQWTRDVINRDHEQPYAIFVGLTKTHTPLYAPDEYFDRFPLDEIELPETIPNDTADLAPALGNKELYGFRRYKMLERHEGKDLLRKWLQAYMACVSFIDDQVGTILDAVENGPDKHNTIIFFTSDHGFHVGEKNFLYKGSLWEPSTRVPLIISGVAEAANGSTCNHPVSLIDIYPTFNELLGLEKNPNKSGNGYELEGHSLLPLMKAPKKGKWTGPDVAITTIPGKNHMQHRVYEGTLYPHFSVRSERYRYSLTSEGDEELYDHQKDPHEWTNLARNPEYDSIKQSLKEQLIELREGQRWKSVENLADVDPVAHFELEFEARASHGSSFSVAYRGDSGSRLSMPDPGSDAARHGQFRRGDWNLYRLRVHNQRHQLWINGRVVSDEVDESNSTKSGGMRVLSESSKDIVEIRNARIRSL